MYYIYIYHGDIMENMVHYMFNYDITIKVKLGFHHCPLLR